MLLLLTASQVPASATGDGGGRPERKESQGSRVLVADEDEAVVDLALGEGRTEVSERQSDRSGGEEPGLV